MAITDAQKVDYLYKKIGFGVAKTDTSAYKSPSNEANPSPLLTRGDTVWVQSGSVPAMPPASNSSVVVLHRDDASSTIECTLDATVSGTNRTWLTNLTDWIPPEFGSNYQVRVFADNAGSTSPESSGVQLFADGSGNNDSWFFDYQSGILNFADTNVPSVLTGKKIFVSGYRYRGVKGVGSFPSLTIGNITISGNTITGNSALTFGGNTTSGNAFISNVFVGNLFYSSNHQPVMFTYYSNANVAAYLPVYDGDILAGNVYTNKINGVSDSLVLSPAGNLVVITGTGALQISTGTIAERPADASTGAIRFNTETNSPEYYGGASWVPIGPSMIDSQVITPDGSSDVYALDHPTTSHGIIVSINGTLQRPESAYIINNGNLIVFAEVPLATDIIEIRFISAAIVLEENSGVVSAAPTIVGTAIATVDSFDATQYRGARYTITATATTSEAQITELFLVHNGSAASTTVGSNAYTTANVIEYSAQVNGTMVELQANAVAAGTTIRIQKLYFAV
jgi:hypothetical protein